MLNPIVKKIQQNDLVLSYGVPKSDLLDAPKSNTLASK